MTFNIRKNNKFIAYFTCKRNFRSAQIKKNNTCNKTETLN